MTVLVEKIEKMKKEYELPISELLAIGYISSDDYINYFLDKKMARKDYKPLKTAKSYLEERFYLIAKWYFSKSMGVNILNNVYISPFRSDWKPYIVDFLFVLREKPHFFIVECDSDMYHHLNIEQVYSDKKKDQMLIAQSGVPVIRFTYKDVVERPQYINSILGELYQTYLMTNKDNYSLTTRVRDEVTKAKIINLLKL